MSYVSRPPVDCGRRIIPKVVDDIASSDRRRPFVSVPRSRNLEDGYEDIAYSAFAVAVNRCSWWIEKHLGRSGNLRSLFYIGPLDIRYLVVLMAAAKTGHVAFLSSHRNSVEAHLKLLDAIECTAILLPEGAPAVTEIILEARPMQIVPIQQISVLLNEDVPVDIYPWQGTYDEVKDRPLVILHTSGSTGVPKPVLVTHGTFAGNDAHQLIPSLGGKPTFSDYVRGKRYFLALPVFHSANLTFTVGFNVFSGVTCVLPPPGPLTVDVVNKVHTHGNVQGSLLSPSMIVDIYNNPDYLANMVQRLRFVSYVGGTLAREVGDPIFSKMKLITLMGSTETKLYPVEVDGDTLDWEYISISPFFGHEMRPSREGLSECVIIRKDDVSLLQGVFSTFPEKSDYPTKDLYEQHPSKPGSWAFRARADDIITLSNAEKLNPVTMEAVISAHPGVASAIIGGHGEFQPTLLIEPAKSVSSEEDRTRFLQEIWPTVVAANRDCPAHGRIMRDFIIFTSPEKPMPRAAKETVQRFAALQLYAAEFKTLYASKREQNSTPHLVNGAGVKEAADGAVSGAVKDHQRRLDLPLVPPVETSSAQNVDLDSRIEIALHRVLPDVLAQHLGPALIRAMKDLLHDATPAPPKSPQYSKSGQVNVEPPPGVNKVVVNGMHYDKHLRGDDDETVANGNDPLDCKGESPQTLKSALYTVIDGSTYMYGLNDGAKFFDCGLDSLQVGSLVTEING